MVSRMPRPPTSSSMQPTMPISVIAERDLWRSTSRRFQRVPKSSRFHSLVRSSAIRCTFLGT